MNRAKQLIACLILSAICFYQDRFDAGSIYAAAAIIISAIGGENES